MKFSHYILPSAFLLFFTPTSKIDVKGVKDTKLEPVEGQNGYKERDGRFEGFYKQAVSTSEPLTIRSFGDRSKELPKTINPVNIYWNPQTKKPIKVRASALKERVYYRLDTESNSKDGKYPFIRNLTNKADLELNEIGFIGSYQDDGESIHVPIAVGNPIQALPKHTVTLWPESSCLEIRYSLYRKTKNSEYSVYQKNQMNYLDIPVGLESNPAGRPIQFTLPTQAETGIYRLVVSTTLRNRTSTSITFLFSGQGD